jgi:hypothetical protein
VPGFLLILVIASLLNQGFDGVVGISWGGYYFSEVLELRRLDTFLIK